jgi:hypothetical protein
MVLDGGGGMAGKFRFVFSHAIAYDKIYREFEFVSKFA